MRGLYTRFALEADEPSPVDESQGYGPPTIHHYANVQADDNGNWNYDFGSAGHPIGTSNINAIQYDENWHSTITNWG